MGRLRMKLRSGRRNISALTSGRLPKKPAAGGQLVSFSHLAVCNTSIYESSPVRSASNTCLLVYSASHSNLLLFIVQAISFLFLDLQWQSWLFTSILAVSIPTYLKRTIETAAYSLDYSAGLYSYVWVFFFFFFDSSIEFYSEIPRGPLITITKIQI